MIGIGVDIERVERFAHFTNVSEDPFLRRVFTPDELAYCFGLANPAEHLAGRFAAKEAVIKALANVFDDTIAYNEIEIGRGAKGAPTVKITRVKAPAFNIQASISHTSEMAVAFVVITDYE